MSSGVISRLSYLLFLLNLTSISHIAPRHVLWTWNFGTGLWIGFKWLQRLDLWFGFVMEMGKTITTSDPQGHPDFNDELEVHRVGCEQSRLSQSDEIKSFNTYLKEIYFSLVWWYNSPSVKNMRSVFVIKIYPHLVIRLLCIIRWIGKKQSLRTVCCSTIILSET